MKYAFFIVGLLYVIASKSQQSVSISNQGPMHIGQQMPDIEVTGVHNSSASSFRFSNFKEKLVLLDFWFGACKGCIETFPKLEALQRKFGEQIQIILVNYEDQKTIDATFKKYRNIAGYRLPSLPSVTGDSILHKLFPVQYYPQDIWIDGSGKFIAATDAEQVTEDALFSVLHHQAVRFDMKEDDQYLQLSDDPLLEQLYPRFHKQLKYYSVIMNWMPARGNGITTKIVDSAANFIRVSRLNMSILELIGNALRNGAGWNPYETPEFDFGKRVELVVKDSTRFFYRKGSGETKKEWDRRNLFSYEAVAPLEQKDELFSTMLQTIDSYFRLQCTIEKRPMFGFALVRTSGLDKIRSVIEKPHSYFEKDSLKLQIERGRFSDFIRALSVYYKYQPFFFVDRTKYDGRIDLELQRSVLKNINELRKELRSKYDLDLVPAIMDVDVLVIKEKGF
jgi:thiol-disulfide isomerase/thioredoxin